MAIINFSQADVLRGKMLEAGWYSFQIARVEGPKPNSAKDGVNYEVVFALIDDAPERNGKEIKRFYSNKAMSMMISLIAAVRGQKMDTIKPEAFTFDTEELVGAKVDGEVSVDTYEGQMNNKVETYLPYKSAKGKGPSF